jgi:hypothetical protein
VGPTSEAVAELSREALIERVLDLEAQLREAQALIAELRRRLLAHKAEKLSPEQEAQLDELAHDLNEEAQKPPPLSQEVLKEERRDQRKRRTQHRPPRHPLPAPLETQTVTLERPAPPVPIVASPNRRSGRKSAKRST